MFVVSPADRSLIGPADPAGNPAGSAPPRASPQAGSPQAGPSGCLLAQQAVELAVPCSRQEHGKLGRSAEQGRSGRVPRVSYRHGPVGEPGQLDAVAAWVAVLALAPGHAVKLRIVGAGSHQVQVVSFLRGRINKCRGKTHPAEPVQLPPATWVHSWMHVHQYLQMHIPGGIVVDVPANRPINQEEPRALRNVARILSHCLAGRLARRYAAVVSRPD